MRSLSGFPRAPKQKFQNDLGWTKKAFASLTNQQQEPRLPQ